MVPGPQPQRLESSVNDVQPEHGSVERQRRLELARDLIYGIVNDCPQRPSASDRELRAQRIMADTLADSGGQTSWHSFRYSRSLYTMIALHWGIVVLGCLPVCLYPETVWGPATSLLIHLVAGVSYWCDSYRWGFLLRRLLPWVPSQNLLVTFPAKTSLRRRIVLMAHADSAPTGWQFRPRLVSSAAEWRYRGAKRMLRFLRRPMAVAMVGVVWFMYRELDILIHQRWLFRFNILYFNFGCYFLLLTLSNLQVAFSGKFTPGANDDLSGCAALAILAQTAIPKRPDDVEVVVVVTGCEEAGTGGSWNLAREMQGQWRRDETFVLVLDSISNGDLRLIREGEIIPAALPRSEVALALEVAQEDPRYSSFSVFDLPAGATDALPFGQRGYRAFALACIDPELGAPRHYHLPSDSPDNLDWDQLIDSIEFAERILPRLWT